MRLATTAAIWAASLLPVFAEDEKPKTLAQAKAEFEKVDKALNDEYAKTKKSLSEWEFKELRDDQREWIDYRDARSLEGVQRDYPDIAEGGERTSPHYWEWLRDLTKTRIEILRGWRGVGDANTWTGRYIDGHGGILELVDKGDGIAFTLQVVRGPTYHQGFIHGRAKKNTDMARFTDANSANKDTQEKLKSEGETWLTFVSKGRWLEIIGTNTGYYHGLRAYFSGRYIRVAEFDAREAAKVEKDAADPDWPLD